MTDSKTELLDALLESFRNDLMTLHKLEEVVEFALADHRQFEKQWLTDRAFSFPESPASRRRYKDWVLSMLEASPAVLRSSLLVMLYAEFEHFLHALCLVLRDVSELSLVPADIAGKGIERSRTYLKRVAAVSFPDTDASWKRILLLRDLRNCVVHAGAHPSAELAAALRAGRFVSIKIEKRIAPTKTAFGRFFSAVLVFNRKLQYGVNRRTKGRIR